MRITFLLFCLLFTFLYKSYGQCEFIIEDSVLSNIVNGNNLKLIFIDIDNDGDQDAFIGEEYGIVNYYKNTGDNTIPVFRMQVGSNNPFDGVDVGWYSSPNFVDIDNDGDEDAFIGEASGKINYYKNIGTSTNAEFSLQTGSDNLFDGVYVGNYSTPTFVDVDNDGDLDAFIGEYSGKIYYYKNTGTLVNAAFSLQTGSNNPLDGAYNYLINDIALTFVDIDNDGDQDAYIGDIGGQVYHYKNTGTSSNATFSLQTGSNNPFDGVIVGTSSTPTFVDIDNDGDQDAFIGEYAANIEYYKNIGTLSNAIFSLQAGTDNPFDGINVGESSTPNFVDIDNDGDQDAFIGEGDGTINYYKNTGTSANSVFSLQSGSSNPFDVIDVGVNSKPTFVDIDNDGDPDAFIGEKTGNINYYKNVGTTTNPVFSLQTASSNPFDGVDVGTDSSPTFFDIDNDGDQDAFIGEEEGPIYYYENTGISTNSVFSLQSGVGNPFDAVKQKYNSVPTFVDIDSDGDKDLFIGNSFGEIYFIQNNSADQIANLSVYISVSTYEIGDTVQLFVTGQMSGHVYSYNWMPSTNLSSSTIANPYVNGVSKTMYYVAVKDTSSNCEYTDSIIVDPQIFAAIPETDGYTNLFELYPNPCRDKFTINLSDPENKQCQLQILDVVGKIVHEEQIEQNSLTINVSVYKKGLYFIKITTTNGETKVHPLILH